MEAITNRCVRVNWPKEEPRKTLQGALKGRIPSSLTNKMRSAGVAVCLLAAIFMANTVYAACPINDPDCDGILSDGDASGDPCDNPCTGGVYLGCDDNCQDGCGFFPDPGYQVFNKYQSDLDGDGVGDVCDNCPYESNSDQYDIDLDGVGDVCEAHVGGCEAYPWESGLELKINWYSEKEYTFRMGDPWWVEVEFVNKETQSIQTIPPDCFNCYLRVTSAGSILPQRYRMRAPYGIPKDVVTIPPCGSFRVRCDLSEMYDPQILTAYSYGNGTYNLEATYANYIKDPDYNPVTQQCTPNRDPCYDLWVGAISYAGAPESITIAGVAVTRTSAKVRYEPATWNTNWVQGEATIKAYIRDVEGCTLAGVQANASKIRLMGEVGIKANSDQIIGSELKVEFDGFKAVQSLGTPYRGMDYYPTVQGECNPLFTAKSLVTIATLGGGGDAVGGTAIPTDKIGLLAPWIALMVLIALIIASMLMLRKRNKGADV